MRRSRWVGAVAAVVTMVTGACGTDDNTTARSGGQGAAGGTGGRVECATGTVSGAGATFPQTIVQQWIKDYGAACPGATINYQAVGSGGGIQQFTAGTVDFGASDDPMKPAEQQAAEARGGPVLHIPWTAGGVAVEYNLAGVDQLRLSPETLAGIFAGTITRWDDAALKDDNPGTKLPSTGIQVVHRSDSSGTTAVFTGYLSAAAPSVWTAGAGKDVRWPTGQGAKGSDQVTAVVKQTPGAVGYAEVSFPSTNSLGVASIRNPAGAFVAPSAGSVSAALADAEVPDDLKVKPNFAPAARDAYPISTVTWALVYAEPADPAKGRLIKSFLEYVLGPGQASAERLFYAPLPASLLSRARSALATMQLQ
jgi:phosphate transport system substrate-binding protein